MTLTLNYIEPPLAGTFLSKLKNGGSRSPPRPPHDAIVGRPSQKQLQQQPARNSSTLLKKNNHLLTTAPPPGAVKTNATTADRGTPTTRRGVLKNATVVNSATTGRKLDSWHKVEDNGSGVTYFWHTGGASSAGGGGARQNSMPTPAATAGGVNKNALYAANSTSLLLTSSITTNVNGGYYSPPPPPINFYRQQPSPLLPGVESSSASRRRWSNKAADSATGSRMNGAAQTAIDGNNPLIWSIAENGTGVKQAPGVPTSSATDKQAPPPSSAGRKPRARRRFLQALLCCFTGSGPHASSSAAVNGNGAATTQQDASGALLAAGAAPNQHGLVPYSPKQSEKVLLPPIRPCDSNKKCLIIDLDETLVHSSFKPVKNPDFIIPVEIDGVIHQVYVLKRPYVDEFLLRVGDMFECILFTASLAKYADPVADLLDKRGMFRTRLFRDACVFHKGNYVKDLNRLSRDLKRVIIIDNSPASYAFHPDNALAVSSWFDDVADTELLDLIPTLERLAAAADVYPVLRNCNEPAGNITAYSGNTAAAGAMAKRQMMQQTPTQAVTAGGDHMTMAQRASAGGARQSW